MPRQKLFEAHGVLFTGESGDQLIGSCPFSGKDDKFYVNRKTWLWDSKTAGLSGNVSRFLELTHQRYRKAMTADRWRTLAEDRRLPKEAFTPWQIGWTGSAYALAIRDPSQNIVDIRMWRPKGKMLSTPTVSVGLWGAHRIGANPAARVYLCEGEWDAIALQWLLNTVNDPGFAVAVPGAGVFKPEWQSWLSGRQVVVLYDHDDAGLSGEHNVNKKLRSSVQKMFFTHWPVACPPGFDVRDWIVQRAVEDGDPAACWRELQKLFRTEPRPLPTNTLPPGPGTTPDSAPAASSAPVPPVSKWIKPPTLAQVMDTFTRWLHLDSTDGILVMLATVVSQSMDGPPVWMFLVGPPGSAKTATLSGLNRHDNIYSTSSLTTHSLISGGNFKEGVDPSLIPRLDGRVMVIKDFTSILAMRDNEKDEIFGILRDAYDGRCGKVFGNGIERQYVSRFTVLAAVTPSIYDLSSSHTSLGERFLKYAMSDNLMHKSEKDIIRRAIQNINRETQMADDLADVVQAFLTRTVRYDRVPTIPEPMQQRIIHLAMFGARMRGSVSRDMYRNDVITSRPSAEVGSRLGIQLAKLAKALAMVCGHDEVTMQEYRILKKVMLDTIPQRTEDMLRHLLRACPTMSEAITAHELSITSRYPVATVSRILQDLNVLDIVVREGTLQRFRWTLSPYIRTAITEAELYQDREELNRPTRVLVRVRRTPPPPPPVVKGQTSASVTRPAVVKMPRRASGGRSGA